MKKLLLIHHSGGIGGAGISLFHIIKKIDKSQYKVFVLCPKYPEDFSKLVSDQDCVVISSETSPKIFAHYNGGISRAISLKSLHNLLSIYKDRRIIKKYIEEINPDIVAVNSMTLFWIGKLSKELNKKSLCFHRETYLKGLLGIRSRIIKTGLSEWFDKVAFISKYDSIQTGKIKAIKKVIYDRVDIELFNKYNKKEARKILNLDDNKKYILYLGGISELKGSDVIMKAMVYLKDDNINLVFVDDINPVIKPSFKQLNNFKDKIKYLSKQNIYFNTMNIYFNNMLHDKVVFLPRTSNPEIYYKACDLIVFPSTIGHQSRPIYEAGIAKIPVLITDFKQTKEFAMNNETAITFNNKRSKNLAHKINLIFNGQYDLKKIIDKNYRQTITNHSLETLSIDLEDFFNFD